MFKKIKSGYRIAKIYIKRFLRKIFNICFATKKSRVVFLFVIPLLFTILVLLNFCLSSVSSFAVYKDRVGEKLNQQNKINYVTDLDNLYEITNLPIKFLNFKVYAVNSIKVKTRDNELVDTLLNIKFGEIVTYGIKTGDVKLILPSVNLLKMAPVPIESAINTIKPIDLTSAELDENHSGYWIFILPTFLSCVLLYVSMVFLFYGFIIVINLWLKFIIDGSPMEKVLETVMKD